VLFTFGGGTQVEYTASGGNLVAWQSLHDRHVSLVDDVTSLQCNDLGEDGLEVEMALGDAEHPFHVYFHVAEVEEE
jgi:hypothetical protein